MIYPKQPPVHVIYEYGSDTRPHTPSYLRFIRPLTHPTLRDHFEVTFGRDYHGQQAEIVVLERLWRPDVNLPMVRELVERIQQAGAKFIYSLDDSFFDLALEGRGWPPPETLPIVEYLLRQAHAVIVATMALKARLEGYNPNLVVLPNALDERLLVRRKMDALEKSVSQHPLTIGYMGTPTHDADLRMILPALQVVFERHPGELELQIVGALGAEETRQALIELPVKYLSPHPGEQEYPLFMAWFTSQVRWDIALAPLRDTPFNHCKSDIKFLDYIAIGTAGIFSQCPAYASSVQHLQTGLLAENSPQAWEDALEGLITNPELRRQMAANADKYLYSERILAHRVMDWISIFQGLTSP